jgi:hypothetical protein
MGQREQAMANQELKL